MLESGRGGHRNLPEALTWYLVAERHHAPETAGAIARLRKKLPAATVRDAEASAARWP
jgi:hypothetical protein